MSFQQAIQNFEGQPISRQILLSLLREYKRPFDKISELIAQRVLVPIKRGLFVPGPAAKLKGPEPFLLANHLLGPSYVSLESALSYWQLIPEQVFEISSVTTARSKVYNTQAGRFSFMHLPLPYYSYGQQRIKLSQNQFALVATPEKAICDKIILTAGLRLRSISQVTDWLLEDMRMDRTSLQNLRIPNIEDWLEEAPKRESLQFLTQTLRKL